jgi:hypothetical protein
MELDSSREANSRSVTQEFPKILWKQKLITVFLGALRWSIF